MESIMILIPLGGLANRFYAIISAIAFCQDYGVKLRIIWFKDWGMGANFNSILELSQQIENVEIIDAQWKDYIFDRPRKRNLWLPFLFQRFYFGERIYEKDVYEGRFSIDKLKEAVLKKKSVYLVQCNFFYPEQGIFQTLRPNVLIRRELEKRKELLKIDGNMIGIHIRRTDHVDSIKNSPLSLFISKIEEEICHDPSIRFYIASDDLDEKRKLKEKFGERCVTILGEVRRDNEQGISDAMLDLYTLASMKKIYGSSNSTYSRLAAQLSGIDLEILSVK